MKNIFKALNVASEKELNNLVESLNLEINDYINFMSMLNETLEPQTIRDNLFQLTESLYNGSYEKLREHISKKPFERKLKEETVYDHSWYEVKKQKYPKRTKDGVKINEGIKDWFKKDNKQYRIEMDSNGAYLSKDKKHIVGDKNDALIISGYKKALKLAKWLNNYEGTTIYHPVEVKDSLNENSSNESEYKVGQKLMYKKNGNTYVIDKVNGKYYDIKDSYSNKVYPVYKNTLDSEFKLLKEVLEDEEVKNDTTEVKEPIQKSSADPEITQFISTTEKVVNNTTNPDILKGLIDSIDAKITLSTDIEQTNKLSELKQKAETKIVSVKNVKSVMESFDNNSNFKFDVNVEIDTIEWDYDEYDPSLPTEGSTTISMTIDELKDCFILGEGDTIDDFSDRDITDALFESTFVIEYIYNYLDELSGGISSSTFDIEIENIDELRKVLKYIFQEEDNKDEEPETTGEEFDESVNYDYDEPEFEVGDTTRFMWGDKKLQGKVIDVISNRGVKYYNVSVYNPETKKTETYVKVDPIDNEMKKIISDYELNEQLDETCSAGATCVSNVSGFSKPIGKTIKRNKKKVKETFDSKLFKESILNDMECSSKINGKQLRYFFNEGKYYLSVDNALVKTFDKDVMIETVDEILYDEDISYKLLEGYSCYEMDILMEDVMSNPLNPKIQPNSEQKEPTSLEDSERNKELLDIMNSKKEISVVDDDSMEIINNQEIVNKDEQSGNYFVKDKMTNEITLVDPNSIKVEK